MNKTDITNSIKEYLKRNQLNSLQGINTALVDMDGVLYDSMKNHCKSWYRLIQELGIKCDPDEFYLYEGMTAGATFNLLYQREFGYGISDERVKELYQRKIDYFMQQPRAETIEGASDALSAIHNRNMNLVLVTGSAQGTLLQRINSDYPNIFSETNRVTAHDVTLGKPHPEPYLKGMAKVAAKPTECFVIENAPLGVQAGNAAGCFTCAITTGPIPSSEMIRSGADLVFASMPEFAQWINTLLNEFKNVEI